MTDHGISEKDLPGNPEDAAYRGEDRRRNPSVEAYFNGQFDCEALYLEPGQTVWSDREKDMIVATVGSGVAISIYDTDLKIGAMGYVLLPDSLLAVFPHFDKADKKALEKAFQPIIDCIGHMKRHGAGKNRIRIRLMGGGQMPNDPNDKGTKNYVFTREYITRKGLMVMNEDLGGKYVRRIHFFPTSGRAVRRILRRDADFAEILSQETKP
jgi:chemotaxis protein CheD